MRNDPISPVSMCAPTTGIPIAAPGVFQAQAIAGAGDDGHFALQGLEILSVDLSEHILRRSWSAADGWLSWHMVGWWFQPIKLIENPFKH